MRRATLPRVGWLCEEGGQGVCLARILNSEEGRTHMMREHRNLIVWPSLIAAGLLAAACGDQSKVKLAPMRPKFWVTPPVSIYRTPP